MSLSSALTQYVWSYPFPDTTPVIYGTVTFSPKGYISLFAGPGANNMGGSFSLTEDNKLSIGPMRTTLMMPSPEAQKRQSILSLAFSSAEAIPFTLEQSNQDEPTLTIKDLVFKGAMTPSAKYGVAPVTKFYDLWPSPGYNSGWMIREVTYDENFVKSTTGEWAEYPIGSITDLKELDTSHKSRVRVQEYVVDGESKAKIFDMTVMSEVIKN